jgi:hypothetical protein
VEFKAILETLVESYPATVLGAIFCDDEGEKVDAYHQPTLDAYDLDLLGAAYAGVVGELAPQSVLRVVHTQPESGAGRIVWVANVESGYYLLAVCNGAGAGALRDELPRAVAALAAHM